MTELATKGDLRSRREAIVREHLDSENRHDFDATFATFAHPRYELVGTGDVYDGDAAVRGYFDETRTAFPDQRNRLVAMHHGDDAVVVEFVLEGTHAGPLRGMPATGRAFACAMIAVFTFPPGGDHITCERVYFDASTILRQLGLASDPRSLRGRLETAAMHPLAIGRAFVRRLLARR
jgi:steroid delta-isomerase-like uncharacterized protein